MLQLQLQLQSYTLQQIVLIGIMQRYGTSTFDH